ncbi:alpha/beta fold hydrolase [Pseudooceanicola sp. C21-150M6]|uniref:alpha/beta fold hydrolase n=1 Tax=Pseudooceanicola sp. C21-150M6 TaxID=3434355 RepID=UPI003D7FA1A5
MRLFLPLVCLVLAACSALPPPDEAAETPLLHDGRAVKGVKEAVVVIPGALSSVGVYDAVFDWTLPHGTFIAYRYPGVDGLPLDHRIDIEGSGEIIAEALNRLGIPKVHLIGYSTGGPIALEAARRMKAPDVDVALLSTASDAPAALIATAEGVVDMLKAMIRQHGGGVDETLIENYRTLLYGRKHFTEAELAERSRQLAALQRGHIVKPPNKMTLAHTSDLMTWVLKRPEELKGVHIGFFHGTEDSIFSEARTKRFAARIHADEFHSYPGQGHLLFVTDPGLWDDIRTFFGLAGRG